MYDFSGKQDQLRKLFRKVKVNDFLKLINKKTSYIFNNNGKTEYNAVYKTSFVAINQKTKEVIQQEVLISAWLLIDLAYYAIYFSNDYIGNNIEDENQFAFLYLSVQNIHDIKEKELISNIKNDQKYFLMYLYGFLGEQIMFQLPRKSLDTLIRELYILNECSNKYGVNIDIEKIVEQKTEVKQFDIINSLLFLWVMSSQNINVDDAINNCINNVEFKNSVIKTLKYYSIDYKSVRESELKRQIFYTKPYIIDQNGHHISINVYLNLYIITHSIVWIIRDYYNITNNQNFINDFGHCFEFYFQEMLEDLLEENEYKRLPEEQAKNADWLLKLGKYTILVEQKSTLLYLDAKQQLSNVEKIKQFAINTIIKAMKQLKSSQDNYKLVKPIKIILLYEEYLKTEILDQVFELEECEIKNDGHYWILTIDEMESLLLLYMNNREKFNEIMIKKIDLEENQSHDGRSMDYLFAKEEIYEKYIDNIKFNKYKKIAELEELKKYFNS